MMRGIFFYSLLVCFSVCTYLIFGINRVSSIICLLVTIGIAFAAWQYFQKHEGSTPQKQPRASLSLFQGFVFLLAIGIDIFLLSRAWDIRTDAALQTPWGDHFGVWTFGLFAISQCLLMWGASLRSKVIFLASIIHFFIAYGIALIGFRYGYGYDPIIHQTAELYVAGHGRIFPIQPMYIGQYALVALIHFITTIPVELVDRGLLPILAAVSLPLVAYYGLKRGYGLSEAKARFCSILLLVYPFTELSFTVPHNLTVLYALWWVFLIPLIRKGWGETTTLFLIAFAATLTHPLLGIPLVLGSLFAYWCRKNEIVLEKRVWRFFILLIGTSVISGLLVCMFGLYRILHGEPFFVIQDIGRDTQSFLAIFYPPQFPDQTEWYFYFVYWYEYLIKQASILVGLAILFLHRGFIPWLRVVLGITGFGILFAMYIIAIAIRIPGVVEYEQFEFILRLRDSLPLFFLPIIFYASSQMKILVHSWMRIGILAFLGIASAVSLYLTYPRLDAVSQKVGWNVSRADKDAVVLLENMSGDDGYVVLSDQIFAVAGLRGVGFERTFKNRNGDMMHVYSISPSEVLYPYSTQALYYTINDDLITALRYLAGNRTIYLVVHDYWYRVDEIEYEVNKVGGKRIPSQDGIRIFHLD